MIIFFQINHQYDIWHLAKGVIKTLTEKSKTKDCAYLAVSIQSISNHLRWSDATCWQNEQVPEQMASRQNNPGEGFLKFVFSFISLQIYFLSFKSDSQFN